MDILLILYHHRALSLCYRELREILTPLSQEAEPVNRIIT